jgi:hypothetical protein
VCSSCSPRRRRTLSWIWCAVLRSAWLPCAPHSTDPKRFLYPLSVPPLLPLLPLLTLRRYRQAPPRPNSICMCIVFFFEIFHRPHVDVCRNSMEHTKTGQARGKRAFSRLHWCFATTGKRVHPTTTTTTNSTTFSLCLSLLSFWFSLSLSLSLALLLSCSFYSPAHVQPTDITRPTYLPVCFVILSLSFVSNVCRDSVESCDIAAVRHHSPHVGNRLDE